MTDYWVFQDKLYKRACVHRSNCSVCKDALIAVQRERGTVHMGLTTKHVAQRRRWPLKKAPS